MGFASEGAHVVACGKTLLSSQGGGGSLGKGGGEKEYSTVGGEGGRTVSRKRDSHMAKGGVWEVRLSLGGGGNLHLCREAFCSCKLKEAKAVGGKGEGTGIWSRGFRSSRKGKDPLGEDFQKEGEKERGRVVARKKKKKKMGAWL